MSSLNLKIVSMDIYNAKHKRSCKNYFNKHMYA